MENLATLANGTTNQLSLISAFADQQPEAPTNSKAQKYFDPHNDITGIEVSETETILKFPTMPVERQNEKKDNKKGLCLINTSGWGLQPVLITLPDGKTVRGKAKLSIFID